MKRSVIVFLALIACASTALVAAPAATARKGDVRPLTLTTAEIGRVSGATAGWGREVTAYSCGLRACGREYEIAPFRVSLGDKWVWPKILNVVDVGLTKPAWQRLNERIAELQAKPALGTIIRTTSNSVITYNNWGQYFEAQVRLYSGRYDIITICSSDTVEKAAQCASAVATAQARKLRGR